MTTVRELIDALSSMDPDATIRVAGQPSYPMEVEYIGVAQVETDQDEMECLLCDDRRVDHTPDGCKLRNLDTDEPCDCTGFETAETVADGAWLVVGDNIGYGVPRDVYDTARYGW